MARYLLSPHAYVCVANGHAIFLDLKQDKYAALEPADTRLLSDVVEGWSNVATSDNPQGLPTQNCNELVRTLLAKRLITDDQLAGKLATPVSIARPATSLQGCSCRVPRVRPARLGNFTAAWLLTTAMLRMVPLRLIVYRVRKRRERHAERAFDVVNARNLMTAYLTLRPSFFSEVNACLKDSLTVIEFFARHGVFPAWVFGVRVNPFAAHSWVQEGSIVINDSVERVNCFNPIMMI